jgi:hypothetical protein
MPPNQKMHRFENSTRNRIARNAVLYCWHWCLFAFPVQLGFATTLFVSCGMSKNYIVASRESARRFVKLYLSLGETPYWFHQVLTFREQVEDFNQAKNALKKLLDSLELEMQKHGDMATVYCMGIQDGKRVHFHLIFLFYGSVATSKEDLAEILRDAVWKRWQKLANGVKKVANRLTIQTKPRGLGYLLGNHVIIGLTKKETGKPVWFGTRNNQLIRANALPYTKKSVREALERVYPLLWLKPQPTQPKREAFTRSQLEYLKSYFEAAGKCWESFKQRETGKAGKVSDLDYMNFRSGWMDNTPSDGETL